MSLRTLLTVVISLLFFTPHAHSEDGGYDQPFTVEYYYRIKWGYEDEWMSLYQKNHWPILMAEMENGDILDVNLRRPRNLAPESHRWDVRVTITFKNILIPHGMTDRNREPIAARLYPDRELFEEEEKRRFELLDGLMNIEITSVDTGNWPSTGQD
jgi:hypothetical protein